MHFPVHILQGSLYKGEIEKSLALSLFLLAQNYL